jgi:biotin carboxylase
MCVGVWVQVNLPACQLQVAMGIPLHRIAEIRRFYGQDPVGQTAIDFYNTESQPPYGHVIACRITAENPDQVPIASSFPPRVNLFVSHGRIVLFQGFKPTSGSIQGLNFYSSPRVWGYFSVDGTGALHEVSRLGSMPPSPELAVDSLFRTFHPPICSLPIPNSDTSLPGAKRERSRARICCLL